MREIIPAILANNSADLRHKFELLRGLTEWVQVDIMDGAFVPNTSVAIEEVAPYAQNFSIEAHLMVTDPLSLLDRCKVAGVKRVIFHLESTGAHEKVLECMESLGLEKGVALNPETPLEAVKPLLASVDMILLLGVHPGFQGQEFLPETLEKVRGLHGLDSRVIIGVDGGVSERNAQEIIESGASRLIVGSALFAGEVIAANLFRLRQVIQ
jgi:ribulose-phosphate 3-epimerase